MTQKVENLIENSGVIFKKMANKNKMFFKNRKKQKIDLKKINKYSRATLQKMAKNQ